MNISHVFTVCYGRRWSVCYFHPRFAGRCTKKADGGPRPTGSKTSIYLGNRLPIFWEGDVGVCVADLDGTGQVGNLREQSILDAWNSEPLLSLREIHRTKRFAELPVCCHCDG
jgi:hypothetical protein